MPEKIQFFKPHPERRDPPVQKCIDCLENAIPEWGDNGVVYCSRCAPDRLKRPSKYLNQDESHGA